MNLIRKLALAAALTAAATTTSMAYTLEWSASGSSNSWSDPTNWVQIYSFPQWQPWMVPPGPSDVVNFEDQLYTIGFNPGWTNIAGAVNNTVDTNLTVGAANYSAVAVSGSTTNHYYTTLIKSGVTLTLGGLGAGNAALTVGDIPGYTPGYYTGAGINYSTITGPGTLVVNEPNGLISVGMKNRATLDLSGLTTFNTTVGSLWVGVKADNPTGTTAPTGYLLLGQTNTIITSANPAAPGVFLGSATNSSGLAVMNLGSVNTFNTDALVVGGRGATAGTTLAFGTNYFNASPLPTFTLRGSAGNTAVSTFSIGDLAADATSFNAVPSFNTASSTADFSGGTVDIWADSIYIGRSTPSVVSNSVSAQGALIVENGTVTATNVFMNYKMPPNNGTLGTASILVLRSNATMNVVKDLYLGFRTNGASAPTGGSLSVSNNAVLNVGGSIMFTNIGTAWANPATIILGNSGTINMTHGGNVFAATLKGVGTIAGANTITVSNALSANSDTAVGTLNLSSNLVVGGPVTLTFNLGATNTTGGTNNDWINVGKNVTFNTNRINLAYNAPLVPGLYTLMSYGGTQSGFVTWTNIFRSPVGLVQSNGTVGIYVTNWTPSTLVWKGPASGSGNWDLTTSNWNNNADKFYQMDSVIFDDTALATNVSITSTNATASITFTNNVKFYTISQSSGFITGPTGLDKWGTNTLIWGGGSGHTFTGPVNINQGMVQLPSVGSASAFGGTDATNALSIANGAMLDLNGNALGSSGAIGRFINLAGSGMGGVGAITTSRGNITSAALNTRTITLTDNATVSCSNRFTIQGLNFPYDYALDLGGHTLTTIGAGEVRLSQFTVTNSGSINVGTPSLGLINCIIDGPGTINLGANMLDFYTKSTTGYVAKAISVANGGSIQNFVNDASPIQIQSAITIANNGTLYITNGTPGGQTFLLSGVISGTGSGLTKGGNSNLVLSAANTYTGPTEVGGGSLILLPGASLASSLIQVDAAPATVTPPTFDVTALPGGYTIPAGQNLFVNGYAAGNLTAGFGSTCSGSGTNLGNVTVAAGATLAPGSSLVEGTLTINSDLAFSGGSAVFKLDVVTNAGAGINDMVAVGGNLSFTGPTTIQVVPFSALANKPYTLFTYGGTLSGTNNITLTSASVRYSFALDASIPGVLRVVPTGNAGNLLWQGGVAGNPNTWDVATTTNWLNGASLDKFSQGDSVTFDDSATTTTVTMAAQVRPGFMTNNSSATYVLNGSGSLRSGTLVANSGTFTFANSNNNVFLGDGIKLNSGNVTFNQAFNATITAQLSSSGGSLNKNGTNTLTWTSPDSTGMSAPVNINAGTLRAASSNVLGSGTITIASGATVDINGNNMNAGGTVHAQGVGADGLGALNNRGPAQTNALNNVVLDGNTTLGAASNRWDIAPIDTNSTATLQGNNFNVVKTGAADLCIRPLTDTGLGDIDVSAGRLIFAGANTTLGNTSSNIVVRTNAVLGFDNGIQAAGKTTLIQQGGQLYCGGFFTNEFDGATTLSNGLVKLERYGQLNLGGNLSGPATLQMQAVTLGFPVTLTLSGSNSYTGGTIVNEGTLALAGSNSLPGTNNFIGGNTNVTLAPGVNYQQYGWPALSLGSVVSPVGVRLVMQTTSGANPAIAELDGNGGTWTGPIQISGNANNNCTVIIKGGTNGLTINGTVVGTNFTANYLTGGVGFGGMILDPDVNDLALNGTGGGQANATTLAGSAITFNSQFNLAGSLACFNSQNLNSNLTKVVFNAPSNNWAGAYFRSGMIQIGVDNALPALSPFQVRNSIDRRFILDLNGHNQGLGAFDHDAANNSFYEVAAWFGNSSTSADSTLSYVGAGTNIWAAFIVDAFDTNAPIQRKMGLTVTSGYLWLVSTIYTNIPSITNQPIAIYTNHGVLQTNLNPFPAGPTPAPIASTYSGRTLVSGGVLQVDRNIPNSPVTVFGAGTLGGSGTLGGPVAIGSGGTLAPGPTIGNLTGPLVGTMVISNNLVFSNSSTCFMKTTPIAGTSDQVLGLSSVSYAGKLIITNLFNAPYTNSQVIKLFDATSYQGAFSTISVTDGSTYSNHLATDGAITILQSAASVNVSPCPLTVNKTPSSMTLSWPSDHTGWRLTIQTNALTIGLRQTNTWYTVPGSTTTNAITVPIDKNQPTIIYRLTYP
jgi:autotransporter-associated beta strand protein